MNLKCLGCMKKVRKKAVPLRCFVTIGATCPVWIYQATHCYVLTAMIALTSRLSDANQEFQRNRLSREKIRTRAGRWSSSLAFPSPTHRMNVTHPTKTHPLPLLSSVTAGGGVEVSQFIREGLPCHDNPNHRLSYLRRSEKDLIVGGTAVPCLLQVQRWH